MSSILRSTCLELVDIGANLGHHLYTADLNLVLERAQQAGLSKIIITGTSVEKSREIIPLVEKNPGYLYFTAGVHPHDAKDFPENGIIELKKLHEHPQCVAVGECGLDYNRNFSPQDVQRDIFRKQLELACVLKRSLFIHERDAHEDMVKILTEMGERLPPAVIHCFTGTADEAKKYIDMGFYIGLTGFLWKDRAENGVQYCLKNGIIPLDRLLIETDAPYMYPKINDKKLSKDLQQCFTEEAKSLHKFSSFSRNEPCSLAVICEMIAFLMGKDPKQVAEVTTANAKRIYGLD